MIIENLAEKIESNIENQQRLTTSFNPKIFKMLSNNIYSNKIGSIIRELVCNAKDSHIEANNTEPFEIHLPTKINPIFKVKDFGVGMSKQEIDLVFSCYGESTKNNSNDVIGAFGIGSKSPFAIVDSFNITSIYNNKKYSYVIYVDSDGYPSKTLLCEIDTIERNGFEVFFGVEEKDFNTFKYELEAQLKYFDFPYKLNGKFIEPFKFENVVYQDENGIICKTNVYYDSTFCYFGGLCYSIKDQKYLNENMNHNFFLKFNIGDIDVSASREDISYTNKTYTNIEERYTNLRNSFLKYVRGIYDSFDNWVDRAIYFLKHYSNDLCYYFDIKNSLYINNTKRYQNLSFYFKVSNKKQDVITFSFKANKHFYVYDARDISIQNLVKHANNEFLIIPRSKTTTKIEFNQSLNQLIIDFDLPKSAFNKIKYEDVNIVKTKREKILVNDSEIYCYKLNYNKSIDKKIRPFLKVKENYEQFKNDNKMVYFIKDQSSNLINEFDDIIVLSYDIPIFNNKFLEANVFIFTKKEFKKFKETTYFKDFVDGEKFINDFLDDFSKNIDEYNIMDGDCYRFINNLNILSNQLKDPILRKHTNKKKVVNYEFKRFIKTKDSLKNLLFCCMINKMVVEKRYSFLNCVNSYYYLSEREKEVWVNILNDYYEKEKEKEEWILAMF